MLDVLAMQQQAMMIDPARYAVVASDDLVWFVGRDLKEQNMMAPFRLTCRRAVGGDVVWKTDDLSDYAQYDLFGAPLLVDGKLYIIAKSHVQSAAAGPAQAVRPGDPPERRQDPLEDRGRHVPARPADVLLLLSEGHEPAAAARSSTPGRSTSTPTPACWPGSTPIRARSTGATATRPTRSRARIGSSSTGCPRPRPTTASAPPLRLDDALLVKGAQSDQIEAVDPNRMKVLWERPISKSSRVLGTDGRVVFFGGPEISAMDLKTKELLWATRIPGGSLESRVLVRPEGIWQLTPRGIFEIDPKSGSVRRIFRGDDLGAAGGDLYLTDRWLLSVSNRTISAYPRRRPAEGPAPGGPGTTNQRASNE